MSSYDPRLTPARPDLAAAHLRGAIAAERYAAGRPMHLRVGVADLHRTPSLQSVIDTQVLYGETVTLYEEHAGWAWVQLANDHYVGYVPRETLAEGAAHATHRVCVNATFIYPAPDIKTPIRGVVPLGAAVIVAQDRSDYAELAEGGFIFARHLARCDDKVDDFVAVAEELLGCPYLWGGKSSFGVDCSGLVQVALGQAGVDAPRDTDLQERALGHPAASDEKLDGLRRGDLVFWKGHVGIMRDAQLLLHANAHHMLVASEPLDVARDRICRKGAGEIIAIKRL